METKTKPDQPIEIPTDHGCLLAELTAHLAAESHRGVRGIALGESARAALDEMLDRDRFASCCMPAYLALAPAEFDRELQLPVASEKESRLDARVLLWPVGAEDSQHPHCDGWAVFIAARGRLGASDTVDGERQPERPLALHTAELLTPADGVEHHIHNRGAQVGLTVHIFGDV